MVSTPVHSPENPGDLQRFRKRKQIIPMGECYENIRRHLLIRILSADPQDPIRAICVGEDMWDLKEYDTKRVGRPRNNWWMEGMRKYWELLTRSFYPQFANIAYDGNNPLHLATLREAISNECGI